MIHIFLSILILLVFLKIFIIIRAIMWLGINGVNYKTSLKENQPNSDIDYFRIFKENKGGFFPFGFKDYKLRNHILELKTKNSIPEKIYLYILKIFQSLFFRYERLTMISTITLFFIPFYSSSLGQTTKIMMLTLAFSLLVGSLLLSVEAIWSHAILGSYAKSFHMLSPKSSKLFGDSQFLIELKVVFSKIVISILSGSISFYITSILYKSMHLSDNIVNNFDRFFHFIYFSLTTLLTIGYGDIYPITDLGIVLVMIFQIQSFTIIVCNYSAPPAINNETTN